MAEMIRVLRAALNDDPDRDDRIAAFLQRKLPHHNRDLERAGHLIESDARAWNQVPQLFGRVIDESLHVLGVKLARHERE
jgi:hypothetical protein